MTLRASLPMYDLPEVAAATDAWWQALARAFVRAGIDDPPQSLTRETNYRDLWRAGDLLFTQTCGYPFTHAYASDFALVATPCYGSIHCEGPRYRSVVVGRKQDQGTEVSALRGRRLAVNGPDSHSGFNALRALIAPLAKEGKFFSAVIETGSHAGSLAAVKDGRADLTAIDCVTFALLERYRPAAIDGLGVLALTPSAPGLPYVTRTTASPDCVARLREGLLEAFADPTLRDIRAALLLEGIEFLPRAAYEEIVAMEENAVAAGYPTLA